MKKFLSILTLAVIFALTLAGCGDKAGGGANDPEPLSPPTSTDTGTDTDTETETEFHKVLTPLKYREGETVENLYYKTVFAGDEVYYEVQPDGEAEPLRVRVADTVIYGIDEGENYIEKVTLKLDESTEIPQYQINVRLEGNTVYETADTETNVDNGSGETVTMTEAAEGTPVAYLDGAQAVNIPAED